MKCLVQKIQWQGVAVASTGVLLALEYLWRPYAWFVDDKRNQYVPAARDIGRRLRDGGFPIIDPNLGPSGNFSLDIQYGLYEPTHWVSSILLSYLDNLALAGFLWAAVYLLILCLGTTTLLLELGARGPWAAAAGAATATSGYLFYWLGLDWIPGVVSIAWLPWLWWAWAGRSSPWRCLGIGVFTYLAIASGWPATWFMVAALVIGALVEQVAWRDRSLPRWAWLRPIVARVVATAGGLVGAALTILPLAHAAAYTIRSTSISNNNFMVVNLADVLGFAAPGLHGDLLGFHGVTSAQLPLYFAGWFALPVLWLVDWHRGTARFRGVLTGALAAVAMLLLTQSPSLLGPVRDPIRALAGFQVFFVVVVVVLAARSRLVVTRTRCVGIAASLLCVAWVSWARDPTDVSAFVAVLVVAAGTLVLVLAVRAARPRVAGVFALVATLVFAGLAFGIHEPQDRNGAKISRIRPGPLALDTADQPVFAAYSGRGPAVWTQWFVDGVGRGFAHLSGRARMAPGYSSISQKYFRAQFCIDDAQGEACPAEVSRLFENEQATGRKWVDLLGYKTIVVGGDQRQDLFRRVAGPGWREVGHGGAFAKFQRVKPQTVNGRVTAIIGSATVTPSHVSNDSQSYQVSSRSGATLVFRDIYWPGYQATLGGTSLPVQALDNVLVSVTLPPGASGTLTVAYVPLSTAELVGIPALAVILLLAGIGIAVLDRRRTTPPVAADEGARPSGPIDGERDEDEPDKGQALKDPV
ncbi:MAG: hypothetical protein ACRDP1_01645 [Nocardioidaceae bacterium]